METDKFDTLFSNVEAVVGLAMTIRAPPAEIVKGFVWMQRDRLHIRMRSKGETN